MDFLWDVRRAIRSYLRRPGFTTVAVLTLALGIGATTALFSVIRGALLAPLPFPEPDRLVWMSGSWEQGEGEGSSPPDFHDYRDRSTSWEVLAATTTFSPPYNLTGGDRPEMLDGRLASAGLLAALGLTPVLGREFTRAEEAPGGPKVVMLAETLWRNRFGADPSLVGRTVMLNGIAQTVVGIAPDGAALFGKTEVWAPMQLNYPTLRRVRMVQMVGRLREGVTLAGAQTEMSAAARRLEAEYPAANRGWKIHLTPLRDQVLGPYRLALYVLFAAVVAVLLIACVNVASLVLSRTLARGSEFAVHMALGASRGRIWRLLLTESLVLALAGGLAGCALAVAGVEMVKSLAPPSIPRIQTVGIDGGVLLFALAASLATGLLFGLQPALRASRAELSARLKDGARGATRSGRFRSVLVVGQVALTLVLLVSAGLLVRSLSELNSVRPGFRTDDLLVTRMTIPAIRYNDGPKRSGFWRDVVESVEQLPGVRSAGVTTELPMTRQDNPTPFTAVTPGGDSLVIDIRSVTPGFLSTLGVPLVRGRQLAPTDRADGKRVVVINESMARAFFPGVDPVGRSFTFDFAATPTVAEVVGVVGDIRHLSLDAEPFREAYFPVEQTPLLTYNLVVHTSVDPLSLSGAVRRAIHGVDPDQPMSEFRTMQSLVGDSLAQPRFRSVLLASFAGLALVLSMVGLYGVVSYMAAQRTREIGIRMALGAANGDILRLLLWKGLFLSLVGVALGAVGAVVAGRILSSLLFGVGLLDWVSYLGASMMLLFVAALASYLPARRAARVEPVEALRYE